MNTVMLHIKPIAGILHKALIMRIFFVWFLILLKTSLFATTGDSLKYLSSTDTLFLYLDDLTGEKIITHTITKGQTLYSLARFYGLNEEQLFPYNPDLKSNVVRVGQVIRVPIPNIAIKRFKGNDFKRWKYAPIMFVVKKGDNLFKISKTLFHMPMDSVIAWNNLPNNTIQPGQRLQVGWMSIDGLPDSLRGYKKNMAEIRSKALAPAYQKQKTIVEQRGAAFWQKKGSDKTDLYCLHRIAKPGSIVSITNMGGTKTVLAKVIGTIPERAYPSEVVVVVAPSVAKGLGAVDEKFFVKVKYAE